MMFIRMMVLSSLFYCILNATTYNVCETERLDTKSAQNAVEAILIREPTNTKCMLQLANIYLKQGKISKGFEILVDAYSIDPHNVEKSSIASVLPFALKVTNLKKQAHKSNDKELWSKLGDGYFEMGIFNEAVAMYKNSLDADQAQDDIRLKLALSLQRNSQTYSAIEELKHILTHQIEHFYANYYLAKVLAHDAKSEEEARAYFLKAKKLLIQQRYMFDVVEYHTLLNDISKELQE